MVVAVTLLLLRTTPSFAQTAQQSGLRSEKEIDVTADSLTAREGGREVEARGNVEVRREGTLLKADEVRLNRETQDVGARGKVSVADPEWKLKAESLQLNFEKETGTIHQGEMFLERGHLSLTGRRFEKFAGQAYRVDEGFFTTCLCESGPPSWKISADEIELNREGEAIIRRGTFYIMDIPVFYLPYGFFPLQTERQSGLLFPSIGYSGKRGFKFEQPFFWAISKSTDATFAVDIETRARVGLLGELRTVFSRDAHAEINLSYFNEGLRKNEEEAIKDRTIADPEIPQNRWAIMASHRHKGPPGWMSYSDIAAYSDDLFTRELSERFDIPGVREADVRRSRYGRSRFGFLQDWVDMQLRGEWSFYQDFIQDDGRTFQKTPQILFRGRRVIGETPLEFRWRAEGINYVRSKDADGLRLDLRPQLVLPFQMAPYLAGSFDLALRETAYHLYQTEGSFERNKSRELVEVRGSLGSSLGRVFSLDGPFLKKVKHVLEPELSYLFIPRAEQRDIPIMDATDRINRRNVLTFSLTNRLWGKFAQAPVGLPQDREVEMLSTPSVGDVREIGRLRLALSYDIDRERKGGDSLSDLDMNLRTTPVDYLGLGFDAGFNPGPWQLTQAAALMSLFDPSPITRRVLDRDFMRPNSLDLSYRFIRRGVNAPFGDNANLVIADLGCPPPPGVFDPRCERLTDKNVLGQLGVQALFHVTDHLLFLYDSSYNTRDGRFTNNRGGIKLLSRCECWTLTLSISHRTNPDDTSFKFEFNLLGLGSQAKELFK